MLLCTVQDIRARNAGADPDEIQRVVDEAVSEVRAERPTRETAGRDLMRVVIDTPGSTENSRFLTCATHVAELRSTLHKQHKPKIAEPIKPYRPPARELRNAMGRAVIIAGEGTILPEQEQVRAARRQAQYSARISTEFPAGSRT